MIIDLPPQFDLTRFPCPEVAATLEWHSGFVLVPDDAPAAQVAALEAALASYDPAAPTPAEQAEAEQAARRPGFDEFISQAQAEVSYLDGIIPTIDGMTTVQVRSLVKRLAQENRQIIRALLYLARGTD